MSAQEKMRIREVVVVEGKYDAMAVAGVVDALILQTDGFSIFSNQEQKALLQKLGRQRGLLVLTDSDAAGFAIRHYIQKIAAGCTIKNAYIPAVPGKERRKTQPSKEGTLGVEGLPPHLLAQAIQKAGAQTEAPKQGRQITYTDLYTHGLSGTQGSAQNRRHMLARLGLPGRLSKKALCQVLNSLYSYEEFTMLLQQKPVLFWDFHGTLTLPDVIWFDAAMEAAAEQAPETVLLRETLIQYFMGACLPWFTMPHGDTRSLTAPGAWWAHCEENFAAMFVQCGFTAGGAAKTAAAMRAKILQPQRYHLFPDALQTLQTLQHKGYQSYILSNNFPELEDIVTGIGLRPYFQKVLVSGLIGYEKPRPEIFETALAAAGNPAAAWMIGDNPRDDMEGGKNAGFTTVLAHGSAAPHANFAVEDLSAIPAILENAGLDGAR